MGKGGCAGDPQSPIDRETPYKWEEIRKHNTKDDTWIVIEEKVFNVSDFKKRHPGGWQLMEDHGGQDATNPFQLYHMDFTFVRKFMKPLQIGVLDDKRFPTERQQAIEDDFQALYKKAKEMNLFQCSYIYHILFFAHIIILEIAAYQIIANYGTGWLPFLAASLCLGACWTQAGYDQHEYGHRGTFHISWFDEGLQLFMMNFTAGFCASFWTEYHHRHHSKTNMYGKDPTIQINDHLFVIGDGMAKKKAEANAKAGIANIPFQHQHNYWFFLGPPLYLPVRFQIACIIFAWRRNKKKDMLLMALFAFKMLYLYLPLMGVFNFLLYFWIARQIMSNWFVWVSLSNHLALPQDDEPEEALTWFEIQLLGTVNLPDSYFWDWYTGGQNMQIEHHLFPWMPRENFRKIMPYVKEIAEKHNVPYIKKDSMWDAFYSVYAMLRKSGRHWHEEYFSVMAGN